MCPLNYTYCPQTCTIVTEVLSVDATCKISCNHSVEYVHGHSIQFVCVCCGEGVVVFVSGRVLPGWWDLTLSHVPFEIAINVYSLEQMFQARCPSPPLLLYFPLPLHFPLSLHFPLPVLFPSPLPLIPPPSTNTCVQTCPIAHSRLSVCALIGSSVVLP